MTIVNDYNYHYVLLTLVIIIIIIINAFYRYSWLNNLQAEIGRFSHDNAEKAGDFIKQKQIKKKQPSFDMYMATTQGSEYSTDILKLKLTPTKKQELEKEIFHL
jgi:hypothetical protein